MAFDALITNATVVDGTNSPRYQADVGLNDGKIEAIGSLGDAEAARKIDATGLVLAPGFIDMHTHSDLSLLDDPGGQSMAYQGVTTQVTGNCSYSPFPMGDLAPEEMRRVIGEIFETRQEWRWSTLDGWANLMESQGVSINVAPQVGNTPLRAAAGALDNRPATPDELDVMKRLLAETMEQGAFSFTTGLSLAPSGYAPTEEIAALAEVAASYGGFYATHARVLPGWHVKMVEEAVEIGRLANIPVQFSHMAIVDRRYYGHGPEIVDVIDRARDEGIDITYDMYPYTAAGAGLNQLVPLWMQEGGIPKFMERLRDTSLRKRAIEEMKAGREGGIPPLWHIHVISNTNTEENRGLIGHNLDEIAGMRGVETAEAVLQLIEEEDDGVMAVVHNRVESDIRFFMSHPQAMIGSDGNAVSPDGLYKNFKPHPRFYGPYPRILGRYVREQPAVLTLEEAIYKMAGFPAKRMGFKDRGHVKEGLAADLVLFDPETVIDNATFEEPHQYPTGIPYVFVAGEPVIDKGKHTGVRPGKVLRNGRA
jgi:N-acyl-D-aspartate/D-glutamate deacylase